MKNKGEVGGRDSSGNGNRKREMENEHELKEKNGSTNNSETGNHSHGDGVCDNNLSNKKMVQNPHATKYSSTELDP